MLGFITTNSKQHGDRAFSKVLCCSGNAQMYSGISSSFLILCSLGVFLGILFCPHLEQRIHVQFEDTPLLMGFLLSEEDDTVTE